MLILFLYKLIDSIICAYRSSDTSQTSLHYESSCAVLICSCPGNSFRILVLCMKRVGDQHASTYANGVMSLLSKSFHIPGIKNQMLYCFCKNNTQNQNKPKLPHTEDFVAELSISFASLAL